ncbi:NiFe-hydrogenase maturation protease [Vibrio halioticoli NBRC 102217]|uniref:NiFe-hydrogenase maturation protease n=1 Tax=Vibrio halioticoli NBRC 102217 TaxID=1219072 RepID=V5HK28_9VIBR|nr:HyaD/HybD family hydrogenase maturation endopeptidase [Vibrio halioticoli]GAD89615.1 NiFe-hydrogenase maturation protease [Vibrio halioticoli NBRC 102217]
MSKILILGIGNILYADEGIGVRFAGLIEKKYRLESDVHSIDIVDGGTLAHGLIPLLSRYDHVVVVDTINSSEQQTGKVYFFDFDAVPNHIDFQGSAHEVEMLATLNMMDIVGDRPKTFVLGVSPTVLESMSFELSEQVQAAVPVMEQALLSHLQQHQVNITQVNNLTITDIATL